MSLSGTALPKPKDWQSFERSCRELFACVLADPHTQLHGRTGQPQHGVDVWGKRNQNSNRYVGVQCKLSADEIADAELRAELEKAQKFDPQVSEFILATTAPRDAKIQKTARELTQELSGTDRPIDVAVWGWEDIEEAAAKYAPAWQAFAPDFSPFIEDHTRTIMAEISVLRADIARMSPQARTRDSAVPSVEPDISDETSKLHGKITALQDLGDAGHYRTAKSQLLRIKEAEWLDASSTEKYRILATLAAFEFQLGNSFDASELLIEAHDICPEHRKAKVNLAKAYLLRSDVQAARSVAEELLRIEPLNAEAAGVLVQTTGDCGENGDPLLLVDSDLHDNEPIQVALIHSARAKENNEWHELAFAAAASHPNSETLKQFSAEAVLDMAIEANSDCIAGAPFTNVEGANLTTEEAAEHLASLAFDAIEHDYHLSLPIAHNAILALRLVGDEARAKQVLESAIQTHHDDQALRLQGAILAHAEGDFERVLDLLPAAVVESQAIVLRAEAMLLSGQAEGALQMLESLNLDELDNQLSISVLATKSRALHKLGNAKAASEIIEEQVRASPNHLSLLLLRMRLKRLLHGSAASIEEFDEVVGLVTDGTNLPERLEVACEASRLNRWGTIVDVLQGRVATDRLNEGLKALIAATINGNMPVAAQSTIESLSPELRKNDWILRAEILLAFNIGEPSAEALLKRYLDQNPADLEMIIALLVVWVRADREREIKNFLGKLETDGLVGDAQHFMALASFLIRYANTTEGMRLAYATLLNHWNIPEAHLKYQGLILMNDDSALLIPPTSKVQAHCAVYLEAEDGSSRCFRIEDETYPTFSDERIATDHEMAQLLFGKRVGDSVSPQERIGARSFRIKEIKHVYLDLLHRSLADFNERFPRSNEMWSFSFDENAEDPLSEMREVTRAVGERDQTALDQYVAKTLPLAFVAATIGKNPLDAWQGLGTVDIQFKTCLGAASEREDALRIIRGRKALGVVVDAITLSIIRRLNVLDAVSAVCGPVNTTQSVLDLLFERAELAEINVGKTAGFVRWRDGEMVYQDYSPDSLRNHAQDCKLELDWTRENITTVPAIPASDFDNVQRQIINCFERCVTDPAVAAQGNKLLLLSDDMGYRAWAHGLGAATTWLQPVLMIARDNGHIDEERYAEAILQLAFSDHSYVSLNTHALVFQAHKDQFELTNDLDRLFHLVVGREADLATNLAVMTSFTDACWSETVEPIKVSRLLSGIFCALAKHWPERQLELVAMFVANTREKRHIVRQHAKAWLIGHSIGMPHFLQLTQAFELD